MEQFGECEKEKTPKNITITEYREAIEDALMTGKNASKLLTTPMLRHIVHECNLIFDKYMVRLNDALPMQRTTPGEKLNNRLFALVPKANPEKIRAEYEDMNEKRKAAFKEKGKKP